MHLILDLYNFFTTARLLLVIINKIFYILNILIKKDLLLKFLSNEEKIEETHIIVDSTPLTVESFFVFYQFLKDDSDFLAFFTEDGRQQLLSLIHNYKILQSCTVTALLVRASNRQRIKALSKQNQAFTRKIPPSLIKNLR
jgi:hypothetical protein